MQSVLGSRIATHANCMLCHDVFLSYKNLRDNEFGQIRIELNKIFI
jgi:hypothetical protein